MKFVSPLSNASVNPPSSIHLSSLDKEQRIFKTNVEVSSRRTWTPRTKSNSLHVRCLKGVAFPDPQLINKLVNGGVPPIPIIPIPQVVTRKDFPVDFKFGCSTSALQTEGSGTEGGRGPSTWDSFIGADNKAVDSYNRYKEDVALLKKMRADTYRFSISWSRLLPDGTISGGINQEGIQFYKNLIDELTSNGITPLVTLFHFDLPSALQSKYNGFLDSQIVDDLYADLCFKTYAEKVKYWITINEPQVFGQYGYFMERKMENKLAYPFTAVHNIILTHATAAKHYQQNYQATAMQDDARIQHITSHLAEVAKAIKLGANVKVYCMWALMDCLEMGSGYNARYGLGYTDYSTLNRYPKKSAQWLKNFVTST
ncbi:hypothetical protein ACH5RR_010970 [Cinchona calisaya]|uniref:Beta-glucosidase n=1 Tax=Cinchona calisaya TaxID=153742 RepID=A0ABD3A3N2_9GENT